MSKYIGTKLINAYPMNRLDYNKFRGWELLEDEDGSDEGFLVEYLDGGKANTEQYVGYVSWSPKDVFERSYCQVNSMSFGLAIEAMRKGCRVAREGWNGKNMYIYLVDGSTFEVNRAPLNKHLSEGTEVTYRPHIDMKTVDDEFVPWVASQSDMLAEDWLVVGE